MAFASNKINNKHAKCATVYIVRIAFMAAMLTAFKLALSFIPNVEVVTLMICVYGSAMGVAYALPATLVFCTVEMAIYGVGSWVLLYYVYWTLLAIVASLLLKGRRAPLAVVIAIVGSVLFGVLSACCDTLFCVANLAPAHLGQYLVAYYIRGLYFDLVHTVSNAVIMAVLYAPLVAVTKRFAPVVCTGARVPKKMRPYLTAEYVHGFAEDNDGVGI